MKYVSIFLLLFVSFFARADVTVPSSAKDIYTHYDFNRASLYAVRSIYLADASGNTMRLGAPELSNDNYDFVLPSADGTANQCLATDGSEVTSWIDVVTPTGAQTLSGPKTLASPIITTSATWNAQAQSRFADADSSNYIALAAPSAVPSNVVLYLPSSDGSSGYVLSTDGAGNLGWVAPLTNPMDSEGDLIIGGSAGAATKLDHAGAANRVLRTTSSTGVAWGQVESGDISSVERAKIAAGSANHVVINDGSGNLSSEATLANSRGGTGTGTYTTGDTLYASGSNTLSKRSIGSDNAINYVASGVPAWTTATALGFDGSKLLIGNATGTTGDRLATKASGASSTTISVEDDNSTTQQFTLGLTSGAATMTLRDAAGNADTVINGETISTYTNGIQVGGGSAGTPTYSFTGDTNTGLYSDTSDTIGFAAGGSTAATLTNTILTGPSRVVVGSGTGNFFIGFPGSSGVGLFQVTVSSGTNTCGSTCNSSAVSRGFEGGAFCLAAWDGDDAAVLSGGTNGCTDGASTAKRCLCAGVEVP